MDPYQSLPVGHAMPAPLAQGNAMSPQNNQVVGVNSGSVQQPVVPSASVIPNVAPPIGSAKPESPLSQTPMAPATNAVASPIVAEDVDLIEKEWVDKAKAIVEKTKTDPYAQNQELHRFKADYMKKRYNKEIKIEP